MNVSPPQKSALAIIAGILAVGMTPVAPIAPSAWAAKHLIVADGPRAGFAFDPALTPYLIEPLDFVSENVPGNKGVFKKSKQIGASTGLVIAAVGYSAAVEPCDMMLIEPTADNLSDFLALKFAVAMEKSPAIGASILPQTSRSSKGSTASIKRFRAGGSLLAGIATSTAFLRGKTRQKVIRDEASEYPDDLAGQGSPHDMITGAYETFRAGGDWKDLWISTPTIKGACHIDREFAKGDQRYWHVPCCGCGEEFIFQFDRKHFIFNDTFPHQAHYVAPCCGTVIDWLTGKQMVRKGRWIALAPGPGKHASWHFDTLSSPFVPWDDVAARFIDARDDPAKMKGFDTLTLGIAHEVKGDAPDQTRLMERREDYEAERVPAQGLLLVAGCDVQHSGIWAEVVAFASNGESWSVMHRFFEGETTDHVGGAFAQLTELYGRKFPDAWGGLREIDALAVDAGDGGRANQVYAWARQHPRAFAVKGVAGWTAPAIGTPADVAITLAGRKIKGRGTVWPVGTWSLKATFYSNLLKDGFKAGAEVDPPGYCHHHMGCDERYFRQQTAEYLKTASFKGRTTRVWAETGPNHLLDCRVYAMAMAEYLGLSRMTRDAWARLAQLRCGLPELAAPDLLAPDSVKIAAAPVDRPPLIGAKRSLGRRIFSRGI